MYSDSFRTPILPRAEGIWSSPHGRFSRLKASSVPHSQHVCFFPCASMRLAAWRRVGCPPRRKGSRASSGRTASSCARARRSSRPLGARTRGASRAAREPVQSGGPLSCVAGTVVEPLNLAPRRARVSAGRQDPPTGCGPMEKGPARSFDPR